MERLTVDVKVSKAIKEFILSTNKSDTLDPDKYSNLWCLLKQHLITVPGTYKPILDRTDYIYIAIRHKHGAKTYSVPENRVIKIKTLFRPYLSESSQAVISRYFEREFKAAFRNYMYGALNNNPELQVKEAIEEFLNDHEVTCDKISFEMLKQDWYRHKRRKLISNICPICF